MPNALQVALQQGVSLDYVRDTLKVAVKPHPKYPNLLHFSYNMIESPMDNPIVQASRGCILDSANNWGVVCWGFNKFFNLGEPNAAVVDWTTVKFYEKADGSLIQVYYYDGKWHTATTGTPDAGGEVNGYGLSFSDLFWKALELYYDEETVSLMRGLKELDPDGKFAMAKMSGMTFMFELVGPMNQVVVSYDLGLKLLGIRDQNGQEHTTNMNCAQYFYDVPRPKKYKYKSLDEAMILFDQVEGHQFEGFVAVDANFNRVKIKHPGYVNLHRIRDGLSRPGIMELIQKGDSEEVVVYFPQLKEMHDAMKIWFENLVVRLEAAYATVSHLTIRKDYALAVQAMNLPFKNTLFNLLKGKSIRASLSDAQSRDLLEVYDREFRLGTGDEGAAKALLAYADTLGEPHVVPELAGIKLTAKDRENISK